MPRGIYKNPIQVNCSHCGNLFPKTQNKKAFCSPECLSKNPYKKLREPIDKDRRLQRQYNITLETYNELQQKQHYQCAICKCTPKTLYVDHCHASGNVRGLLCHLCNVLLGHAKDSTAILQSAINYVHIADLKKIRGIE